MIILTDQTRIIAGLLLLTVAGITFGGWYLTRIVRGIENLTGFQQAFARAGHAHAGVLVILSLVALLYADVIGASGLLGWVVRLGVPLAAVLMSAGFFLSSLGRGRTRPNGLIVLLWAGALCLVTGAVGLGLALLAHG